MTRLPRGCSGPSLIGRHADSEMTTVAGGGEGSIGEEALEGNCYAAYHLWLRKDYHATICITNDPTYMYNTLGTRRDIVTFHN